jgi:hypothetical protein
MGWDKAASICLLIICFFVHEFMGIHFSTFHPLANIFIYLNNDYHLLMAHGEWNFLELWALKAHSSRLTTHVLAIPESRAHSVFSSLFLSHSPSSGRFALAAGRNLPAVRSLVTEKWLNLVLRTTLLLAFSVVLHLMLLLLNLSATLYTNHLKHIETSYILLRLTFSVCNISWHLMLQFVISVANTKSQKYTVFCI